MMKKYSILSAAACLCVVQLVLASTPNTITLKSQKDFEKGTSDGISINAYGQLYLAPEMEKLSGADKAFFWSGVADSRGTVFVAGGEPGVVYRLARRGKLEEYFSLPELDIYAVAVDGRGNVFAASSPNGKVFKLTGPQQKPERSIFFDPEEVYVWSMAVDGQNNLYVATGEQGHIYKVTPAGKASLFFASEDAHIRCITFDPKGNLIAGTSGKGLIVRIDKQGKPFVLYDSPLVEITDLAVDSDGSIYAAASGAARLPRVAAQPAQRATDEGGEDVGDDEAADLTIQHLVGPTATGGAKRNSLLYRVDAGGTVHTLWEKESEKIFALGLSRDGELLLGTGDTGKLFRVSDLGEKTLVNQFEEQQVTVLAEDGAGNVTVATSNAGNVYRLRDAYARQGEYLSKVFDTSVVSQWGELSWEADRDNKIVLYTRTGNTTEPDKTWSAWSSAYTKADGQVISSPAARFIQLKVAMQAAGGGKSPLLKQVTFSYLQKNIPPVITSITLHAQGDYFPDFAEQQKSNSSDGRSNGHNGGFQNQSPGRKTFKKGFRSVSWKAKDINGDDLQYDLYYKGESERHWRLLTEEFTGNTYSWDSELFPDGRYVLKIVVSDGPSNPDAFVQTSTRVSQPFLVDNSGPTVRDIKVVGGKTLTFTVQDALSNLASVQVGVNAEEWRLVYPADGICDSKHEVFEVPLQKLPAGENIVVIKATDALDNVGFGKKTMRN